MKKIGSYCLLILCLMTFCVIGKLVYEKGQKDMVQQLCEQENYNFCHIKHISYDLMENENGND